MRIIIYDDGQVLVKRKVKNKRILERCRNDEIIDKVAYWKYVCCPEFREELRNNESELKYTFRNIRTGQIIIGKSPNIRDYKYVRNYEEWSID